MRTVEKVIGSEGPASDEFDAPWDVLMNAKNEIFVCDSGNHRIVVLA